MEINGQQCGGTPSLPAIALHPHVPEEAVCRLVCWLLSGAGGKHPQGKASRKRPQTLESRMPHTVAVHTSPHTPSWSSGLSVPVEVHVELTPGPSSGGRGLKFPSRVHRNKLLCGLSHVSLLISGSKAIADSKN